MAPRQVDAKAQSKSPSLSAHSSDESESDFPSSILPTGSPQKSSKISQDSVVAKPVPGSPEFQALDPVTVSDKVQRMVSVSRRLSFGHAGETPNDVALSPPAELHHDKRTRKPSEKAAYMAQPESEVTPKARKDSKNAKGKGKSAQETRDDNSSGPEILSVDSDAPLQQTSPVKKRKQGERSPSIEFLASPQKDVVAMGKGKTAKKRLRLVPQSPNPPSSAGTKATSDESDAPLQQPSPLQKKSVPKKSPVKKRKQGERAPSIEVPNPPQKHVVATEKDKPAKKRLRLVPQSPKPPPASPSPVTPVNSSRSLPVVTALAEVSSQAGDDSDSHEDDEVIEEKSSKGVKRDVAYEKFSDELLNEDDEVIEEKSSKEVKRDVAYEEVSDELLRKAYSKLPRFPACELLPFASSTVGQYSGNTPDLALLGYSPLLRVLKSPQSRNFANAVNFLGSGQMINPTRDSTTAAVKDGDRLIIPGNRRPAVLITTGVVFSCNIWEPMQNQRDRVKKIQVVPLAYEYDRLLGWVGSIFGRKQFYGNVTPDLALGFITRKEASSQGLSNPSPKKQSKFFVTAKPPGPSSGEAPPPVYPAFRNFDDLIPIYDAREQRFRFDADAFNNINKLPTLDHDLPPNSIAAIGYTCNTFPYAMQLSAPRNETGISFNIQFVILLAELPE